MAKWRKKKKNIYIYIYIYTYTHIYRYIYILNYFFVTLKIGKKLLMASNRHFSATHLFFPLFYLSFLTYLVKLPQKQYIVIVTEVIHFYVRKAMHYEHHKITNTVHAFLTHKQDFPRTFIKKRIAEGVLDVIVAWQR